ncbi:MAG: hypothetical protein OXC65_01315 [Thiotrichales bacterium]|nr:hypothetical protein [Thiotrichales bacterium]
MEESRHSLVRLLTTGSRRARHQLRARRMAQRMTSNQASAAAVMRQGRWPSVGMVAKYTRHQSAAEALG